MTFLTIARAAGFFGVLAIIVLSLVPGTYRPHTGLPGVAEHFIAYCSTAFAFALGFRSSASRIVIALVLTLLAGSMEVLQLWVPGRHSAIIDAVFSSLGGLLGIALGELLLVLATQAYTNADLDPKRGPWVILSRSGTSAHHPTPEESAHRRRRGFAPIGIQRVADFDPLRKGVEEISRQIDTLEDKISSMPAPTEPSPEAGMNIMRKAVAKNDLTKLKNHRARITRRDRSK